MLLIMFMVLFLACETGTRYDKNTTKETVPRKVAQSGLVSLDDIEALLDDKEVQDEQHYDDEKAWITPNGIEENIKLEDVINSFSNGIITDGLDVKSIREGKHKEYVRLVFDVYADGKQAKRVGRYEAKHDNNKKDISVILNGYRKFSAPLPSFPYDSLIEQIYFEQYLDDNGLKFHIKLRENAEVKIFDLKNPARIVFDIKSI